MESRRGDYSPRTLCVNKTPGLPPVHRGIAEAARRAAEVVVVARAFRRQRRANRGHCGASAINRHGNGTALEV